MRELTYLLGTIAILFLIWDMCHRIIYPKIIRFGMKELHRNPKWIMSKLQYYGFDDIDIILCKSKWGNLPRFEIGKNNKLELWLDDDSTLTKDAEDVGRLALCVSIKFKYGLWFPDKPIYWLSILLYMLDGGNIKMEDKIKQETS